MLGGQQTGPPDYARDRNHRQVGTTAPDGSRPGCRRCRSRTLKDSRPGWCRCYNRWTLEDSSESHLSQRREAGGYPDTHPRVPGSKANGEQHCPTHNPVLGQGTVLSGQAQTLNMRPPPECPTSHRPEQHCLPFPQMSPKPRHSSASACPEPRRSIAPPMAAPTNALSAPRRDTGFAIVFTRSSNRWPSIGPSSLSHETTHREDVFTGYPQCRAGSVCGQSTSSTALGTVTAGP
jgi:hypothetical protein